MLTQTMLADAERHVGTSVIAIAYADFGNGGGVIYGLTMTTDGDYLPFSWTDGMDDFKLWHEFADQDPSPMLLVKLIDRIVRRDSDMLAYVAKYDRELPIYGSFSHLLERGVVTAVSVDGKIVAAVTEKGWLEVERLNASV